MTETLHIKLLDEIGFGKTVLMPGDPLRAKYIAEKFFENPVAVNNVRGVNGYTGFYKGVKISVMASGMGMPSIGIYSSELYSHFGVESIIRVGSAGALTPDCPVKSVVAGMGACTDSAFGRQYSLDGSISAICDFDLLLAAKQASEEKGVKLRIGNLFSSDVFYDATRDQTKWAKMGCLAVEMEAAALYMTALYHKKRALALCTISNLCCEPFTSLSAAECRTGFDEMIEIALEAAVKMAEV